MVERVERAGPAGGRRGRGAVRAGAAAGGGAGERGEKMKTEMANATARTVGFTVPRPAPARAHTLPPQPCATLPPPAQPYQRDRPGWERAGSFSCPLFPPTTFADIPPAPHSVLRL